MGIYSFLISLAQNKKLSGGQKAVFVMRFFELSHYETNLPAGKLR